MKRRWTSAAAVAVALLVLPAIAVSQVTKTKDGYLMRIKWKKGDVFEYSMSTKSSGLPINFEMQYSLTVLDVKNKIAEVEMTMTSPMINEPTTLTVKMNDRGMADEETAAAMSMGNNQIGLQFPEKALKVGDSWDAEQPLPQSEMEGMQMKMKTTYTFEGLEIVNKVPCAKFTVDTLVEMSGAMVMTVKGNGVIYIENKTGQLYQSSIETTTEIDLDGTPMKVLSTTEIKRK